MLRCPMCRGAIDRFDLGAMGLDVSPAQLKRISARCDAVRAIGAGGGMTTTQRPDYEAVARLVRRCEGTRASDGFVFNVVLLSIERAIFHRKGFMQGLVGQLGRPFNAGLDEKSFIDNALASHVDVLIKTANAAVEDDDDFD